MHAVPQIQHSREISLGELVSKSSGHDISWGAPLSLIETLLNACYHMEVLRYKSCQLES